MLALILALAASTASGAGLPNVQSGTATIANGASSTTASLTAVTPAAAFLVFGVSLPSGLIDPVNSQVSGTLTNSTTITFQRGGTSGAVTIAWYVAEFAQGVTVQRGRQSITGATADVTISSVNLAKTFVLVSVATTGTALGRDDFFEARLTSATNLRIAIPALGSSTPTVDWQVIEYGGSAVQSGQVSFATTDTSKTATLTSVNTNKSWLVYSYQLDNNATINANISSIRGRITNATTLTFDRVTSGNAATLSYFLVEFTDRTTVQSGSQNFTTAATQNDVTITAVDTARTLAAGGTYARGGQTAYSTDDDVNTAWFTLALTSSTNLRLTRGMTGSSAADLGWFVVQFLKRRVIVVGTAERAGRQPLRRE